MPQFRSLASHDRLSVGVTNTGGSGTTGAVLGATMTGVMAVCRYSVLPWLSVGWLQQGQEIFCEPKKLVPSMGINSVSLTERIDAR